MVDGAQAATATLLKNGQVLVAGGSPTFAAYLQAAEFYDPMLQTWSMAASMATARGFHTANLLPNGAVIVTGGTTTLVVPGPANLSSCEIYWP